MTSNQSVFSTALLADTPTQLASLFPKEAYSYIYALSDPTTKSVRYVGKTNNLAKRYWAHCGDKKSTAKALWIQELAAKGLSPEMDLIDFCEANSYEWEDLERKWIATFCAMGFKLLNATDGGDAGRCYSPESREKIRQSALRQTPEKRAAIRAALIGKKRPAEVGIKVSLANKGWNPPATWREKQSLAKKGKPISESTRLKRIGLTGVKRSPEVCKKISDTKRAAFAARKAAL